MKPTPPRQTSRISGIAATALLICAACGAEPPPDNTTPPPPERNDESSLQQYISIYPDHPEHTPAAMLRRADLWAAEGLSTCRVAQRDPCDTLGQALNIASRLVRDFPDSRLADDALLRVGVWRLEERKVDLAMSALTHLVCRERAPDPFAAKPAEVQSEETPLGDCTPRWTDSDQLGPAWQRVAEQFFDGWTGHSPLLRADTQDREVEPESESLPYAAVAYARMIEHTSDPGARLEAKLAQGWCFYLLGRWRQAFRVMAPLAGHEQLGEEALLVATRSALATDWDGNGEQDAAIGVDRPEIVAFLTSDAPGAATLVAGLAEGLAGSGLATEARRAFTVFLERWPDHPFAEVAREGARRRR